MTPARIAIRSREIAVVNTKPGGHVLPTQSSSTVFSKTPVSGYALTFMRVYRGQSEFGRQFDDQVAPNVPTAAFRRGL